MKQFFRLLSSSLVFSFLILMTSCAYDFSPSKSDSNQTAKKYNYFFKATVSEETKRSLNQIEIKEIDVSLSVLENELSGFMSKNNRSESYDLNSKSLMAAEIMVNDKMSNALYTLEGKEVQIQFSFNEMLCDNIIKNDTEQKNTTGKTYSFYTFSGKNGNSRNWANETIYGRNLEGDNSTAISDPINTESSTEIGMSMKNPELASDFYTDVYKNLENKDGVSVAGDESNRTISLASGVEITVEYEMVSDGQKGWKKKFKKAVTSVTKVATKTWDNYGPQIYGAVMITAGVACYVLGAGVTIAAIMGGPACVGVVLHASPWWTALGTACITSGYLSIKDDEIYVGGKTPKIPIVDPENQNIF